MARTVQTVCWVSFWLAVSPLVTEAAGTAERPNVVLIMTDNHGAWTLGCYGNRDIRTPSIDRLAGEGMRFTRAFSSNPVCSPTRATFLTGLMPSQHGVHSFLVGGRLQIGPQARSTLAEFTSLPEVLAGEGYACGLVGKWHLGDNLHPQEGFDDYWITMPHGGTSTFYDAPIIENGKVRTEPEYLTDFWTRHAVRFIDQQAESDQPFFLFLSYNGPYSLGRLLLRPGRNRHAAYYAEQPLLSFPREPSHPWQYNNRDYQNNPLSLRRVATEVSGVDDGVASVLDTLERRGLGKNTLVIFVADQGWVGGHGGFFGMGDHTRPTTARDGMMRIPMIWRQPGRIEPGAKSDRLVTNYDLMPTLLDYLGLGEQRPANPPSPGRSFAGVLKGQPATAPAHDAVFYEFEDLRCIRTADWKYVHRRPNGPHELYDLAHDPDEFVNLVGDDAYAPRRAELQRRLNEFFDRYAEPRYDLWNGGGAQTRIFSGIDEELAQHEPVEPPPLSEGFAPAEIQVPEGFTVELAAGPPLVTHPTLGCFDDRGRLFVCNNAGVNLSASELEEQRPNAIRLLEDTDDDGRFDRSTVFADQMTYPMGGAWHDGALYVASPPKIWRLEDTDGDGQADRRDVVVSEFGYTGNAASIHGCFLGPDGRIYWCDGYHGHEFRDEAGQVSSKREGSYLFSCRPDGSDVRIHCGGGMDNPVEVDFTQEGEMLGTVNILYSRPRVDALVHWLYGGAYPHRERVLSELKITGDLLGPVHRFGHVAVSGTLRYRSGALDHRWRDNMFATFFNAGKVARVVLERDGATFRARQREFLTGTSPDFHPTDVIEDADGSLLVVDTGGWFYRGCPTSQFSKPDVLGAIYRVRREGMTPLVDPWGKRIDWDGLSDARLVRLLNDTRFKVREQAIAQCAARGAAIVPALAKAIRRRDIRERRNAVWALTRLAQPQRDAATVAAAQAAIRTALDDATESVRQAACRAIGVNPDPEALAKLCEIVEQDAPPVRREAATALGRLGGRRAVPVLLRALARAVDRAENHALIYALIEINAPSATAAGLAGDDPAIQRGALLALDQMDAGKLAASEVAALLDADDRALRTTALEVLRRIEGDWSAPAIERLTGWLADEDRLLQRADVARGLVTALAVNETIAAEVGRILEGPSGPGRMLILEALADGRGLPPHASWIAPLKHDLAHGDAATVERALAAVAAIEGDQFHPQLDRLAADASRPALLRVKALSVRSGGSTRLSDKAFAILADLVANGAPAEAGRAAQMLSGSALTTEQLLEVAPLLETAGPLMLRDLIRPYQRNRTADVGATFLSGLENARSLLSLPTNEVSDVVKRYPAELLPRANALLDRLNQQDEQRLARLDQLAARLGSGDPERGRQVFFSEKAKCADCHRVGNRGEKIGPDLTTIGENRSDRDLLESIVFPSASIVRQYESYTVVTVAGRVYNGLIVRETADTVHVQQQVGDPVAIPRAEIDQIAPSTVSVMPKGLEQALDEQQLVDVVAWLKSLRQVRTAER